MSAGLPIPNIRDGNRVEIRAVLRSAAHPDQPAGIGIGQRAEEHLIDDGEHGRVDADAEGQGENCGQGESGGLDELPQRVLNVVPEHYFVSPPFLDWKHRNTGLKSSGRGLSF